MTTTSISTAPARSPAILALLLGIVSCGGNGTQSTDPSVVAEDSASDAAVEAGDGAATCASDYPEGPYGKLTGQVVGDLELSGYVRFEDTGLASEAPFAPFRFSELRAKAACAKFMLVHLVAFW